MAYKNYDECDCGAEYSCRQSPDDRYSAETSMQEHSCDVSGCKTICCQECIAKCATCQSEICPEHTSTCIACGDTTCPEHTSFDTDANYEGKPLCGKCGAPRQWAIAA